MQKVNSKMNGGYTIIETMIAISLFIIIVMSGMGALLNANLLHQKSFGLRSIMDNFSFVMEDMSRNIRTGSNFHCFTGGDTIVANSPTLSVPKSCANGWGVSFEAAKSKINDPIHQIIYKIETQDGGTTYKIYKSENGAVSFVELSPNEATIDPATGFSVLGAEPPSGGNKQQPLITIRLVGKIIFKNITTPFSLQSSVSARLIDL